ncbi:MAG: DUF4169 family protein [Rhizobiales bacterium]|jgi:hypothetical protein|nr:DUF4169 family protein [Hyphomicrobiales bacterium]
MAEIINLRVARKRAEREAKAKRAEENRIRHGLPKAERQLQRARDAKTKRDLDGHRLESGDDT